jgi:hypothetical protein
MSTLKTHAPSELTEQRRSNYWDARTIQGQATRDVDVRPRSAFISANWPGGRLNGYGNSIRIDGLNYNRLLRDLQTGGNGYVTFVHTDNTNAKTRMREVSVDYTRLRTIVNGQNTTFQDNNFNIIPEDHAVVISFQDSRHGWTYDPKVA